MRYGFWLPVFGGWLRNIDDESMPATWPYVRDLAVRAEEIGFDLTLIAELNLNDIKGPEARLARRLVHHRRARSRNQKARAHGRRPAHLPLPRPARQASRQHRPHRQRPPHPQRRLFLVERRGHPLRASPSTSTTIATLAPRSGSTSSPAAGAIRTSPIKASSTPSSKIFSRPSPSPPRVPPFYCRRGVRNCQKSHRRQVRRVPHARR